MTFNYKSYIVNMNFYEKFITLFQRKFKKLKNIQNIKYITTIDGDIYFSLKGNVLIAKLSAINNIISNINDMKIIPLEQKLNENSNYNGIYCDILDIIDIYDLSHHLIIYVKNLWIRSRNVDKKYRQYSNIETNKVLISVNKKTNDITHIIPYIPIYSIYKIKNSLILYNNSNGSTSEIYWLHYDYNQVGNIIKIDRINKYRKDDPFYKYFIPHICDENILSDDEFNDLSNSISLYIFSENNYWKLSNKIIVGNPYFKKESDICIDSGNRKLLVNGKYQKIMDILSQYDRLYIIMENLIYIFDTINKIIIDEICSIDGKSNNIIKHIQKSPCKNLTSNILINKNFTFLYLNPTDNYKSQYKYFPNSWKISIKYLLLHLYRYYIPNFINQMIIKYHVYNLINMNKY